MTAKITLSTSVEKADLLTLLAKELGVKKNQVFESALSYYADIVETTVIKKRLQNVENGTAKILSKEEFDKEMEW